MVCPNCGSKRVQRIANHDAMMGNSSKTTCPECGYYDYCGFCLPGTVTHLSWSKQSVVVKSGEEIARELGLAWLPGGD